MNKWLIVLLLSGCTTLSSPEAVVGCQAADAVSTAVALDAGLVEANPLMAAVIDSLGIPGLFIAKGLIALALLHVHNDTVVGVATGATCAVAVHNFLIIP